MSIEKICRMSKNLIEFGKAVREIKFDEEPDYKKLIFLLNINLLNDNIIPKSDILFYGQIKPKRSKNENEIELMKQNKISVNNNNNDLQKI